VKVVCDSYTWFVTHSSCYTWRSLNAVTRCDAAYERVELHTWNGERVRVTNYIYEARTHDAFAMQSPVVMLHTNESSHAHEAMGESVLRTVDVRHIHEARTHDTHRSRSSRHTHTCLHSSRTLYMRHELRHELRVAYDNHGVRQTHSYIWLHSFICVHKNEWVESRRHLIHTVRETHINEWVESRTWKRSSRWDMRMGIWIYIHSFEWVCIIHMSIWLIRMSILFVYLIVICTHSYISSRISRREHTVRDNHIHTVLDTSFIQFVRHIFIYSFVCLIAYISSRWNMWISKKIYMNKSRFIHVHIYERVESRTWKHSPRWDMWMSIWFVHIIVMSTRSYVPSRIAASAWHMQLIVRGTVRASYIKFVIRIYTNDISRISHRVSRRIRIWGGYD